MDCGMRNRLKPELFKRVLSRCNASTFVFPALSDLLNASFQHSCSSLIIYLWESQALSGLVGHNILKKITYTKEAWHLSQ